MVAGRNIIYLVAALVLLSGCTTATVTPTPTKLDLSSYTEIIYEGNITANEDFLMEGELILQTSQSNQAKFNNVSLKLYDENQILITERCLGHLKSQEPISISFTTPNQPKYVIITSPDFWSDNMTTRFGVDYFIKSDRYQDEYVYHETGISPGDFPVNVTDHSAC